MSSLSSTNTLGTTSNSNTNKKPSKAHLSHLEGIALAFYDKVQEQGLVQDRKYRLQTYPKVLLGEHAVTAYVEVLQEKGYQNVSREQATQLGRDINAQFSLLKHVTNDHELKDEYLFYRFHHNLPTQVEIVKNGKSKWDIMDMLEENFDIQDRAYHFRTYRQCFVGREAVDVVLRLKLAIHREDAVKLVLNVNGEVNCLEHVTRDHHFADAFLFFRFIPRNQRMLNPGNEGQNLTAMLDAMMTAGDTSDVDSSMHGSSVTSAYSAVGPDVSDDNKDEVSVGLSTISRRSDVSSLLTQKDRKDEESVGMSDVSHSSDASSRVTQMDQAQVLALLPPNVSLQDIATALERDLIIKDHRYRLKVYKNCFVAKDAVSYLVTAGFAPSRSRAEMIGRQLQSQLNLFHHVKNDHKFRDKYYFFRFTPLEARRTVPSEAERVSLVSGVLQSSRRTTFTGMGGPMPTIPSGRHLDTREESTKTSIQMALEASHTKLEDVAEAFKRGMKVSDRVYFLKTYHKAFYGPRAIDFLVKKGFAESRQDAMLLGRLLAEEFFLFEHVENSEKELIDCPTMLYRLVDADERMARMEVKQQRQAEHKDDISSQLDMLPDESNKTTEGQETTEHSLDPELKKLGALFRQGVNIKHHRYHGKVYPSTFIGSQAVDFLVNSSIAETRREAVHLGRRLMHELNQFDHVLGAHDFTDDYKFYRFEEHRSQSQPKPHSSLSEIVAKVQGSFSFLGSSSLLARPSWVKDSSQISPLQSADLSAATDYLPLESIALDFRKNVQVRDRRYRFSTYKDVFVGSDAVDYLVGKTKWASSRKEAEQLGQTMMRELNLFYHVTRSHGFVDEVFFYRFTDESDESMLNRLLEETEDKSTPFLEISGAMTPDRLINAARIMEEGLQPMDHYYRLRVYKETLVGNEIVSFIVDKGLASSRAEAIYLGRAVCKQFMLLYHVTMDHQLKDSNLFYRFATRDRRLKGKWFDATYGDNLRNKMMKAARRRKHLSVEEYWGLVEDAVEHDVWDVRTSELTENIRLFRIESDDPEWEGRVRSFEKSVAMRAAQELRRLSTIEHGADSNRVDQWASAFIRLDPRQQIHRFYNEVARTGASVIVEDETSSKRESVRAIQLKDLRPLFRFLPINLASVFSVWRPTSYDAMRKLMTGDAVGKGLDIKGKSAKRGKLSGYVPFLQIGRNKDKKKIRRLSPNHMVKVFYGPGCRRARDNATGELEQVLMEMIGKSRRIGVDCWSSNSRASDSLHGSAGEGSQEGTGIWRSRGHGNIRQCLGDHVAGRGQSQNHPH
jgi:Domain found in Dishevelled, Egl-10, and Pleckstrin (DEP)